MKIISAAAGANQLCDRSDAAGDIIRDRVYVWRRLIQSLKGAVHPKINGDLVSACKSELFALCGLIMLTTRARSQWP